MNHGHGVIGHRFQDVFVVTVASTFKTTEYRASPESKWQDELPIFLGLCDQGHESHYLITDLFKPINGKVCKQCQIN